MSVRSIAALGALSLGLVAAVSCSRFVPDGPGLSLFQIETGGHAELACEACHGPPPFAALPTDCLSCHEEDRKEPNPGHHYPQSCDAAGCHAVTDLSWADIAVGHDFLPLEGSHSLDCSACHADLDNYADLPGISDYCWNCHEEDRQAGGHYTDAYDPFNPLYRWDCGGCHPTTAWNENPIFHEPRTPHGAVTFGGGGPYDTGGLACTPTLEAQWVAGCDNCHPSRADFTQIQCFNCHDGVHGGAYFENVCLDCHESAQAATDLLAPPNDVCTSIQ